MAKHDQAHSKYKLAGYAALIEQYELDIIPSWHTSLVATSGIRRIDSRAGIIKEIYPPNYWPGETLGDHLEFALKYDGTNLAILDSLFQKASEKDFLDYIRSKPTGKYVRRLWFLYEFLTGKMLPLDDLKQGNYIDLLERDAYYTVEPGRQIRRQRVNNNLLGERRFCPTVRRTDILRDFETNELHTRCQHVVSRYAPELLKRALSYLYTKETKSSFEIEHITPSWNRTERFVALLQLAEQEDFCRKPRLIDLQNRIVDARFRDGRLSNHPKLRRAERSLAERAYPLCGPKARRFSRPDGRPGSHSQTHGSRRCFTCGSSRRHRLWIRLFAPI